MLRICAGTKERGLRPRHPQRLPLPGVATLVGTDSGPAVQLPCVSWLCVFSLRRRMSAGYLRRFLKPERHQKV